MVCPSKESYDHPLQNVLFSFLSFGLFHTKTGPGVKVVKMQKSPLLEFKPFFSHIFNHWEGKAQWNL